MKAIAIPGSTRIQVNIPKDTQEFLGWKAGDDLLVEQNKPKDQIIITRIKKEDTK